LSVIDRWRSPERYGWILVVAACALLGTAFGTLISVSVFLKPLEDAFGWHRSTTSLAYSSAALLAGVGGIFMGRLVDRIAARPIVVTGALVLGASQLLLSQITALWQLYLIYGVMVGALSNAAFLTPLMTNVGFWFDRRKGLAMGILLAGQSLGAAALPFLARELIGAFGWRQAYVVLGLIDWALLIPLALLVREPPGLVAARAAARQAEGRVRPLIAPERLTATLCVAVIFCCICMSIPIMHLYPLALESGMAPAAAASLLTLLMAASMIGRVGVGKIAEHFGGVVSLLVASGLQTSMVYWFTQVRALPALMLVVMAFGVGYGGVIPSYAIIVRELIPVHRVGRSMGLVFFCGNTGMALGAFLGGLLYDWSGDYRIAFGTGALAGLVNLTLVGALFTFLRGRQALQPQPDAA
jgi:MFS family permease